MVLWLLSCFLTTAQPGQALADSLFQNGAYYDAATEYERLLFRREPDSARPGIRARLAQAYALAREPDQAGQVLESLDAGTDSMAWNARRALAEGLLAAGRSAQARQTLSELLLVTRDSLNQSRLFQDLAWLDIDNGEFQAAAKEFEQAGETALSVQSAGVYLSLKNPDRAALLSAVVPGAGEMYAGQTGRGLLALSANTLVAAGVVYSLVRKNYLDAVLLFSLLSGRFYYGSQSNARAFAEESNDRARHHAAQGFRARFFARP